MMRVNCSSSINHIHQPQPIIHILLLHMTHTLMQLVVYENSLLLASRYSL